MNLRIARQRLGLRQSSGAFGWLACIAKAPEDWRTPKPGEASDGSGKVNRSPCEREMRAGSFRKRDGLGRFFGCQLRRAGTLQRINHRRLRGVVGGRIGPACDGDGAVGGVVIGQKFLVLATVESGLGLV